MNMRSTEFFLNQARKLLIIDNCHYRPTISRNFTPLAHATQLYLKTQILLRRMTIINRQFYMCRLLGMIIMHRPRTRTEIPPRFRCHIDGFPVEFDFTVAAVFPFDWDLG